MTGLRLGYLAVADDGAARPDAEAAVLHDEQRVVGRPVRRDRRARRARRTWSRRIGRSSQARRDLFYAGIAAPGGGLRRRAAGGRVLRVPAVRPGLAVTRNAGALRHARSVTSQSPSLTGPGVGQGSSLAGESWAITEYLIARGRIGCIPGADFGPGGEGYLRFCFARDRRELAGALASLAALFRTR